MATSRGGSDVKRFIAQLPSQIEGKLLSGAARAAANVVADEARSRSISPEVTAAIKVATSRGDGHVTAKVQAKGEGAYIAPWLEYGTDPHFISVDESQRGGRSIGRVNREVKTGSLVIGGTFVGATVHHPGARPHPFLRVSLDIKEAEAIAAAQGYINARVKPSGIIGASEPEGGEA